MSIGLQVKACRFHPFGGKRNTQYIFQKNYLPVDSDHGIFMDLAYLHDATVPLPFRFYPLIFAEHVFFDLIKKHNISIFKYAVPSVQGQDDFVKNKQLNYNFILNILACVDKIFSIENQLLVLFRQFSISLSPHPLYMLRISIPVIILPVFFSCNTPQQSVPSTGETDTSVVSIQVPETNCFASSEGDNRVHLTVEKFPNVVTGRLVYSLREKDANTGTLDGVMRGDTLIADYQFMSEGQSSVRQVAFLVQDSVAVEGFGEVEERDGKMIFKDASALDFSKGIRLRKISCTNDVPETGGSELLFMYRWDLAELDGRQVSSEAGEKAAHLLFSPGQVSTVAGSTGCNRLRGTFELKEGNKISFSPLVTTKMACVGNNSEPAFLEALSKADGWSVTEKELVLKAGDAVVARFAAATADAR